ncbi:cupin domain-containing protein [Pedobacter immunditicola]|uniref:cupin domain-containing protein n=1 Tax=Pedobacter immunditicola TaxID=3133440 RepID=UPI00309DB572
MSLLLGLFLILSANVRAQDPVTVAPNVYKKILLENDNIRVVELELAPQETVPWHSHPDHFVYALTDGKLELTDKGKPAVVTEIKAGEAIYIIATTHMAKNIGETPIKFIVTDLKTIITKK